MSGSQCPRLFCQTTFRRNREISRQSCPRATLLMEGRVLWVLLLLVVELLVLGWLWVLL